MEKLLNQRMIPILQALERHQSLERTSVHVPGHKAGRGFDAEFAKYAGTIARLDATELPGLDDLHQPHAAIAQAEALAAEAWGSDHAFFLVNGSTVGNLAAVLSVVAEGETAIVGRDAHQSVWHALALARARVIAVTPARAGSLLGAVRAADLEATMDAHPEAVAVVLTSPTYYGVVADLPRIVEAAHARGKLVIVDEAHGAHLAFHPSLPVSAVHAKADIVVHSAHKMTAALTQTGILHVNGQAVNREAIRHYLRVLQTSSPSYLLLASIDAARAQLAAYGQELLGATLLELETARSELARTWHGLVNSDFGGFATDPFKWTIESEEWGIQGDQLAMRLSEQGAYVELYDPARVLLAWSYANSGKDVARVVAVIRREFAGKTRVVAASSGGWDAMLPRFAEVAPASRGFGKTHWRDLDGLAGQRAVRGITLYPPGIPLLLADEVYTPNMIQYIKKCAELGLRLDGFDVEGR